MERMKKLFLFRELHCGAAEEWLNMQAGEGWALERITAFSFARFTRAEAPRQYAVRLGPFPSWANKDKYEGFKEFFAPFGWKHITALRRMHIFEADREHEPLESDVEAEALAYAQYHKRALGRTFGILLLLSFFIFTGFFDISVIVFFSRPLYLAVVVVTVITAVLCLVRAVMYWRYKLYSRQAIENGSPLPALSLKAARRAGVIGLAGGILLYAIWISIAIWDASLSPMHNNAILMPLASMVGAFSANLSYRKWDFKKGSALKSATIVLVTVFCLGAFVYFFMPSPEFMSISDTEGLPVLHMPGVVDEYNYYYHTATPLMAHYEYTEYDGNGKYYGSLCVDSATYDLADIAFRDVAYNVNFAGFLRHEEDFEPFYFPGVDKAMINRKSDIVVIKHEKRVVCVRWRYGVDMLSDMELFERVREVFFE